MLFEFDSTESKNQVVHVLPCKFRRKGGEAPRFRLLSRTLVPGYAIHVPSGYFKIVLPVKRRAEPVPPWLFHVFHTWTSTTQETTLRVARIGLALLMARLRGPRPSARATPFAAEIAAHWVAEFLGLRVETARLLVAIQAKAKRHELLFVLYALTSTHPEQARQQILRECETSPDLQRVISRAAKEVNRFDDTRVRFKASSAAQRRKRHEVTERFLKAYIAKADRVILEQREALERKKQARDEDIQFGSAAKCFFVSLRATERKNQLLSALTPWRWRAKGQSERA